MNPSRNEDPITTGMGPWTDPVDNVDEMHDRIATLYCHNSKSVGIRGMQARVLSSTGLLLVSWKPRNEDGLGPEDQSFRNGIRSVRSAGHPNVRGQRQLPLCISCQNSSSKP